jgi:hypothetical protein
MPVAQSLATTFRRTLSARVAPIHQNGQRR